MPIESVDAKAMSSCSVTDDPAALERGNAPEAYAMYSAGDVEIIKLRDSNVVLRNLRRAEVWMDRKLGVEAIGVDRIPDDQRQPPRIINMILFWFSMLMSPTLISIGLLGPVYGLSVNDSVIITLFSTMLGAVIPAFTATLSAPTGLRQIAVCRFAFGIWGAKICGILNIIVNVGFGVVNSIIGGQLLRAASGNTIPLAVGIIVVIAIAFIISFFGFKVVHHFESVAWVVVFILLCVQWGQSAVYFPSDLGASAVEGLDKTGACLSYFAIIFGTIAAWCSMAGDYYVHYPADINGWLVFVLTWIGLVLPSVFIGVLGNFLGGVITTNEVMNGYYTEGGVGALLVATLRPSGWAKAVAVFYCLSFIANLIGIFYSSSLSLQLQGRYWMAVPRFIWNILLAGATLGLAWGGKDVLETILNNFLSLLGYWTLCFGPILAIEHFFIRPKIGGYNVEEWQDQSKMPWGIAGTLTLCTGIGISFLGMAQVWYTGPAAKPIGAYGGDVGDYLVLVTVLIAYPLLRLAEIKYFGR